MGKPEKNGFFFTKLLLVEYPFTHWYQQVALPQFIEEQLRQSDFWTPIVLSAKSRGGSVHAISNLSDLCLPPKSF